MLIEYLSMKVITTKTFSFGIDDKEKAETIMNAKKVVL